MFKKGDIYFLITSGATGKLIDISEGTTADGAKAIQWGDNGGTNQHFRVVKVD